MVYLKKHIKIVVSVLLLITVCIAYWQVANCDFVTFDDDAYVYENHRVQGGLTFANVVWAFTTFEVSNWHPVTWLSYMLDYQLFGLSPQAFHLINLFFHIINTILLLYILHRMTHAFWPSAFVAALFALHPLHVESVAWIAERKDVLSVFFGLLTIGAYDFYVKRPGIGRYLWVFIFFVLGLMSKPMIVMLPFILLLLDYWPLCRLRIGKSENSAVKEMLQTKNSKKPKQNSKKSAGNSIPSLVKNFISRQWPLLRLLIWEKIPLFAAAGIAGLLTMAAQQKAGAIGLIETFPLLARIENAFVAYILYIGKMFWPQNLVAFYSHPGTYPFWQYIGSALILILVTVAAVRFRKKYPYLIVGWLWYLISLLPVIGIVQAGGQSIADRYTYLPLIGLFIMITWLVGDILPAAQFKRPIIIASSLSILLACLIQTRSQVLYWKNSVTLFQHVFDVTGSNGATNYLLGNAYAKQGRCSDALRYLTVSVRQNPGFSDSLKSLLTCLDNPGQVTASTIRNNQTSEQYGNRAYQYNIAGFGLLVQKRTAEAIPCFRKALELQPDFAEAQYNLGNVMAMSGMIDTAAGHYRKALKIMPNYAEAHNNLGSILYKQGKINEAIEHFSAALRLKPGYADAQKNLQIALKNKGAGR